MDCMPEKRAPNGRAELHISLLLSVLKILEETLCSSVA